MTTLLALLPLLLVLGLLASGCVSALVAGLAGLSATLAASFIVMPVDQAGWHTAHALQIPENIRLIPQPS